MGSYGSLKFEQYLIKCLKLRHVNVYSCISDLIAVFSVETIKL